MIGITEICKTLDWASECGMDEETRAYFSSHEQELEAIYEKLKEEGIYSTPCSIEGTFGLSSNNSFGEDERKKFKSKLTVSNFKFALTVVCLFLFIGCLFAALNMLLFFRIDSLEKIFLFGAAIFGFLIPAINPIFDFFTEDRKPSKKPILDFRLIEMRKKWSSYANIIKLEEGMKSWIFWKMSNDQEVIADSKEQIESHLKLKIWLEDGMPIFCFNYQIEMS